MTDEQKRLLKLTETLGLALGALEAEVYRTMAKAALGKIDALLSQVPPEWLE